MSAAPAEWFHPAPNPWGTEKRERKHFLPLYLEREEMQVLGDKEDNITQQKMEVGVYFKHWGKTSQYMKAIYKRSDHQNEWGLWKDLLGSQAMKEKKILVQRKNLRVKATEKVSRWLKQWEGNRGQSLSSEKAAFSNGENN